jgi:hypothetical protein
MRSVEWCFLFLAAIMVQGCSARMWYDGFKQAQMSECSKLQEREREECLRDAGMSYDQYERERQESFKKEKEYK